MCSCICVCVHVCMHPYAPPQCTHACMHERECSCPPRQKQGATKTAVERYASVASPLPKQSPSGTAMEIAEIAEIAETGSRPRRRFLWIRWRRRQRYGCCCCCCCLRWRRRWPALRPPDGHHLHGRRHCRCHQYYCRRHLVHRRQRAMVWSRRRERRVVNSPPPAQGLRRHRRPAWRVHAVHRPAQHGGVHR